MKEWVCVGLDLEFRLHDERKEESLHVEESFKLNWNERVSRKKSSLFVLPPSHSSYIFVSCSMFKIIVYPFSVCLETRTHIFSRVKINGINMRNKRIRPLF